VDEDREIITHTNKAKNGRITTYLSTLTLNVSDLNSFIKVTDWHAGLKTRFSNLLPTRNIPQ
jgi:hypothetical protein